jgi:4-amino-4-deoxy-L-arabinose transferase-like glycosyltransferase
LQPSTLAKRAWLLLILVVIGSYFYGLGRLPLVGPDEPRYAQVAREMFLRGDLITPTLGGHTWFEKPALLYWMMIGSFRLFGVSEAAARLGSALSGLLTILAVYWIGRRLELKLGSGDRRFSFLSTLVIASSCGLFVFSRAASFDIVVTMTITVALGFFLAAEIDQGRRRWFLAGFYVFVGVSLLAKGLIGIVIPYGVIGAFYVMRRRLPDRAALFSIIWGLPLALAVAALWYGPVIARHGWPFIDQFFIQHHFARYLSNKYQHHQPFYFYLPVMLILALPWTPFLIDSLIRARGWQWRSDDATNKARVFALAWLLVPIVFFSFSGSKLPAYILPSLPAAALLVGERLNVLITDKLRSGKLVGLLTMRLTGVMLLLLAVAGIVFVIEAGEISVQCGLLVVAPLILIGGFVVFRSLSAPMWAAVLVALVTPGVSVLALRCAVDQYAPRESVRELIRLADAEGYSAAPVLMFSRIDRSSEFYASGRVVYGSDGDPVRLEKGDDVIRQAWQSPAPFLIVIPLGSMSQLNNLQGVDTSMVGNNGRIAVVAVRPR